MRISKVSLLSFFLLTIFLSPVLAQQGTTNTGPNSPGTTAPPPLSANIPNPLGDKTNLIDVFNSILDNLILPLGATLAVLAFIWSGFMFVTAQGNPAKIQTARLALLYTAVGTAILLGARLLGLVIANTIQSL